MARHKQIRTLSLQSTLCLTLTVSGQLSQGTGLTVLLRWLPVMQNDPWGAARYYAEAEKQEELAENTATELNVSNRQPWPLLHKMCSCSAASCSGESQIAEMVAADLCSTAC
jgi:hypothetical protein